ncbi:MAG TPA: phosphoglycerate kinase, partial [Synergistales bacterium]|nr:phosphoglycerate kinase [Synergistales bacterium]
QLVDRVGEVYKRKVRFCDECIGPKIDDALETLGKGEILLLENIRFCPEETKNDTSFAEAMAKPFDIFVMDAFSASHRAHASTNAIQRVLPSYAGKLMEKEVTTLASVKNDPEDPFVLILGGAKVSDKIGVLETLLPKTSSVLIGGGMAFTFLKVQGYDVGLSLLEEEKMDFASAMIHKASELGVDLVLPVDVVVSESPGSDSEPKLVGIDSIPNDLMGLDIGPATLELFGSYILKARTILWNGPMGVFEKKGFEKGTETLAEKVAEQTRKGCLTVVGGGDTASAVKKFGYSEKVSHVSTGGGASLEFFEDKILPGIEPLLID